MLRVRDLEAGALERLFARFGMQLERLTKGAPIEGSYWGESEAGLVGSRVLVRGDTPVHSALHEGGHFVCMDEVRRSQLHRDAGGDHQEENAVCYLQILLADQLANVGRLRMQSDMDEWGYTFRLGSARAWFEQDADDARQWLQAHGVIDAEQRITWALRR